MCGKSRRSSRRMCACVLINEALYRCSLGSDGFLFNHSADGVLNEKAKKYVCKFRPRPLFVLLIIFIAAKLSCQMGLMLFTAIS